MQCRPLLVFCSRFFSYGGVLDYSVAWRGKVSVFDSWQLSPLVSRGTRRSVRSDASKPVDLFVRGDSLYYLRWLAGMFCSLRSYYVFAITGQLFGIMWYTADRVRSYVSRAIT